MQGVSPYQGAATWPPTFDVEDDASRYGEIKLFTLWNVGAAPPFNVDAPDSQFETKNLAKGLENENCWWIVTVCAQEVIREIPDNEVPLTRQQLTAASIPTSRLRARITWVRAGEGCCIDVDIGSGFRLAIEGCNVDVKVLGPRGRFREAQQSDQRPLGAVGTGGIFLDTLVSGHIVPCWGPNSDLTSTLTQIVTVPTGTPDLPITIPAFARRLKVFQPAPGILFPLNYRVGAAGPVVANVFFSFFNLRSSIDDPVPQVASHITTGAADPFNNRTFTFVWTLEL